MSVYGQLIEFGPFFSSGSLCTLKVYHYASGTTTLKDVYIDREKGSTAAQPLASDANGIAFCYADGLYKFRIDVSTDGVNYSTLYTQDKWAVTDQSSTVTGEGAAIASAATITLGSDGDFFHVTGSTGPVTALSGSQARVTLVFDSTPTLTHSGNLLLLNANSFAVSANSVLSFVNEGAGVWREESRALQSDAAFRVVGSSDATKQIALEVDGLTTATTRTWTAPDKSGTVAMTSDILAASTSQAGDIELATQSEVSLATPVRALTTDLNLITILTPQSPTTTSADFSSIPAGTYRITIMFVGVSTNGTDSWLIQLGDSGGIENSGYLGVGSNVAGATNSTAGLLLRSSSGSHSAHGQVILSLVNPVNFSWVMTGILGFSDTNEILLSGGSKTLSAQLDRVRITTVGGTDVFDAGVINVSYQR